jgi:leucyl-tRNA synthetase
VYDSARIVSDTVTIAVQVNGKLRDTFEASADISEDDAKHTALTRPNVQKYLDGKEPKKVIYVEGKLISIVV